MVLDTTATGEVMFFSVLRVIFALFMTHKQPNIMYGTKDDARQRDSIKM